MTEPLILCSEAYCGIWLETVGDGFFYAQMDRSKLYLVENAVNVFIKYQKEDGQFPCYVWDGNRQPADFPPEDLVGYGQIQECVPFAFLAYQVYLMNKDRAFLEKIYRASRKWENWLRKTRMTRGNGLVEMFCGYDTGQDQSGRFVGISCPGNYCVDGKVMNAAVLPPEDGVTPIIAVDMNCNFYATLKALALMAEGLGLPDEAADWNEKAVQVKKKLFEVCFDETDCFFYDVDKKGNKRKYLSCTIFHLFMGGVLDQNQDKELIDELYRRYIGSEKHFATPYPYPSMSISDPASQNHPPYNCWGYFVQGALNLRCTIWMDKYGFSKELDHLCSQFIKGWTKCFDSFKLGQELDPITGEPSGCSEWNSNTMLFYLYAAKRLGLY